MKKTYLFLLFIILSFASCNTSVQEKPFGEEGSFADIETIPLFFDDGKTIKERFGTPLGYKRLIAKSNTFKFFLQNLPLKTYGEAALYHDGKEKEETGIYISVVNMPISKENLQFCSNTLIRLKAEYLYAQKSYEKIKFNTEKGILNFNDFAEGDFSQRKLNAFLVEVMSNSTAESLVEDFEKANIKNVQIGDILIQQGNPNGHAVIVVDVAENDKGERVFILAQSHKPAQEIQIIINPEREDISPWYEAKEGHISTPEWRFLSSDLMRFTEI